MPTWIVRALLVIFHNNLASWVIRITSVAQKLSNILDVLVASCHIVSPDLSESQARQDSRKRVQNQRTSKFIGTACVVDPDEKRFLWSAHTESLIAGILDK